ncbi:MAG: tetratricopeptide repeat protein [Thermoplasmata archaeon]|nr:MAG: tetratricopeptide repeat protein [Thermoplasmata archaeon]
MAQRIYLTAEEKILIHLFDYSKFRNQWEVPFNVTQEGIASAVGIARCNVSREIKKLREKEFIEERVAHIKGVVRKRKVYFLSMDGMVPAKQIKAHLENSVIKFRDSSGILNEIKLTDLNKHLDIRPTMLEILRHISSDNIIDYRALQVEITDDFLSFTDKAPTLKYFFGRTDESDNIQNLLDQEDQRIIIIQGIAGVGKTALATKLLETYKKKLNVFWFKFYEWSTLNSLLTQVSEFLGTLNRTKLKSYVESVKRLDINEISEILNTDLKNLKALLIFDDFHKIESSPKLLQFFQSLCDLSKNLTGPKIMILSRQFITFYTPQDTGESGIVSEVTLSGLDQASSYKLLAERNVDQNKFEKIYELTQGHPLFLELVDPNETLDNLSLHSDIKKYIHSEIFTKLPEDGRKLLGIASVFRFPIPSSVFFIEQQISYDTIDRLIEKRLLNEYAAGYMVHDLVREFFTNRLTPQIRTEYHKAAAEYYILEFERLSTNVEIYREDEVVKPGEDFEPGVTTEKPSTEVLETKRYKKFDMERRALQFCLEAQYHFIQAEDHQEASRLAIEEGVNLISHGYLDEFKLILNNISETSVVHDEWTTLQILQGDILTIQGDWDNALSHYKKVLEQCLKLGFKLRAAEALRNLGAINYRRGELHKSVGYLQKALKLSEEQKDYHGIANVHYWLGVVLNRQGEYDRAIAHFNRCMTFAEKINFLPGIAKTYTGISDVLVNKGEYEDAIKNYLKSIDIFDQTGNVYEKSEVYNRIGITYCKQGGHEDDAIKYYTKRIEISKQIGDVRGEGYGLSNAAECYASKGNLETALDYCEKALNIFTKMDEKRMIANTLMVYGIVFGFKRDWQASLKYFEDSIKIAKSINSLDMQAQIYFNFGFMLRDLGLALQSPPAGLAKSASAHEQSSEEPQDPQFQMPDSASNAFARARGNIKKSIELYRELKNEVKVKRLSAELAKIP